MELIYIILAAGLSERFKSKDNKVEKQFYLINKKSKIILVTSAFHMNRAEFLFKKHGFKVFPYPVDFQFKNNKITILDFIPSVGSLSRSSFVIREVLGRMYYRVKFLLK